MIDAADRDGTSVPSVVVQHQGQRVVHTKGLILPQPPQVDKGKGKLVDDYENASASLSSNNKQLLASSNTNIASSGSSSPITEIDDKNEFIYVGKRIGFTLNLETDPSGSALPPRRIFKSPASPATTPSQ